jgi:hypothetical protein
MTVAPALRAPFDDRLVVAPEELYETSCVASFEVPVASLAHSID